MHEYLIETTTAPISSTREQSIPVVVLTGSATDPISDRANTVDTQIAGIERCG